MPFYEVIYETGAHSIMFVEDENEALEALTVHHERATNGEVGGPSGHTAERIKRVLVYDEHPGSYGESQAVPTKDVHTAFSAALDKHAVGDLVSVPQLTAELRDITNPLVESGPHESNYKAPETSELKSDSWGA